MPQAILLQDVDSLGERGAVVDVSPGYLRNYLVPRKLAEPATTASIDAAARRREMAERAQREAEDRTTADAKQFAAGETVAGVFPGASGNRKHGRYLSRWEGGSVGWREELYTLNIST